ncbi:MAG TPA: ATP-binding cassette domain-containing protein [Kineosporiaceae bacterium]
MLQLESVECGAAALAMVLAYFRTYAGLPRLRVLCGVSRDGSRAGDLVRAARTYGLTAAAMEMSIAALAALPPPAILFWSFNHYLVYEGWSRGRGRVGVHVNDPARGRRRLTIEEFRAGFTGVVLTFAPGPDYQPSGQPSQPVRELLGRLSGIERCLVGGVVAGLLLAIVDSAAPAVFVSGFYNLLFRTSTSRPGGALFALMATVVVLIPLLISVQQRLLARGELMASTLGTSRFMRHLLTLPIGFFRLRSLGDVAQRLRLNQSLAVAVSRTTATTLASSVMLLTSMALIVRYDVVLGMIAVSGSLVNVLLMNVRGWLQAGETAAARVERTAVQRMAYSCLRVIETIKAAGSEQEYVRRWGQHQAALRQRQQALSRRPALLGGLSPAISTLTTAVVLLAGGARAIQGHITVGALIAVLAVLSSVSRPASEQSRIAPAIQEAAADLIVLKDIETAPADSLLERSEPDRSTRLVGTVAFDSVRFGYARLGEPLLRDISFTVEPGEQLGIVGRSGSGKSSISRLLAGLHQPWSGVVSFDGIPSTDIPRSVLAASVAYVDQDIFLFQGSVRDNITLWDPSIPDEDVVGALADACLDDLVSALPQGIHSAVGQDGWNLSGGQRQQLDIARALVRSPSVLVLDEATSAVDAETEHRISVNVRRRGCALVVIAHRLSMVRNSDEIIVLSGGTVVERGTPKALLAAGGPYAAMLGDPA